MALTEYKKKRSFNKTPEPAGQKKKTNGALHFVVQQHDATRLHYDFRLEMEGVLKSWAVPKGPSMNPEDKRLAMMVEDHPYDYKDFEGIIPPGNYGAGTVIVWDEGTYEPAKPAGTTQKEQEKELLKELQEGNLKFILHGQKLRGEFALVHIRGREENAWLLIKKKDKFAKTTDITKKNKSVQSGLNLAQVATSDARVWESNKKTTASRKKTATKAASSAKKKPANKITSLIKQGTRSAMPNGITPMLATLTDKPFDNPDWLFEIKWDGYRALAFVEKGKVSLLSRRNISFNKKFPPIVEALQQLDDDVVLDGEIVSVDESGKGDFQQLQQWQKTGAGILLYYAFDILWLNGYDLRELPLTERKAILKSILPEDSLIRYSDHIEATGKDFYELAEREGLEGIMAKHAASTYIAGARSSQWLKVKTHRRQEAVIAGFTEPRKSRKYFGALVLGIYENGELVYAGHSGTGFTEKSQAELYKKMKPLISKTCPFRKKPKTNMPCTWLKPALVCEIKFSEWTKDNLMRMPVFMGLREDKKPKEVTREQAIAAQPDKIEKGMPTTVKKQPQQKVRSKKAATKSTHRKAKDDDPLLDETAKKQVLTINGQQLTFTNLDKIYWPKEKIAKRDLINYYHMVAPYILPYLKDRPQSLNRNPDGISKSGFYQKDVTGKVPGWITTYPYVSESENKKKKYLVCTDEASLLYMANLGCIEMNPWLSTIHHPDNPDWCVIDLDPGNISFDKVIEAAQVVKQVADEAGIDCWCKTSGSTGLHIYIPLNAKYTYEQSRQLAELIVTLVHQEIPSYTSLERSPAKRKNKIYLDYLQNRPVQTIAAPYSVRPKPGATVSAPLHWEEVKKGLEMQQFTITTMHKRIQEEGDIFKPVLGKGINLEKVIKKIAALRSLPVD